jgi:hypothetical protein
MTGNKINQEFLKIIFSSLDENKELEIGRISE